MNLDAYIAKFGMPQCAVCKKPVDRLLSAKDDCMERIKFAVLCHGEVETVEIDKLTFYDKTFAGWAAAFVPALPPEPPRLPSRRVA